VLNASSAALEPDGTVRILVAGRDPGAVNWLDTAGHATGYVIVRWLLPDVPGSPVAPEVRVIRIDAQDSREGTTR